MCRSPLRSRERTVLLRTANPTSASRFCFAVEVTVRSERAHGRAQLNLLFRWFVGLNMDDPVWHPTTFTKNRDRLLSGDVAAAFFDAVQTPMMALSS